MRSTYDRAEGNPLFLTEMLRTLAQSGAIAVAPQRGRGRWDMDAVRYNDLGGNVVDSSSSTFASCRRRRSGCCNWRPPSAIRSICAPCRSSTNNRWMRRGRIYCRRCSATSSCRSTPTTSLSARPGAGSDSGAGRRAQGVNPTYRFLHDRVQQAAYALIDPDAQAGRSMIDRPADPAPRERTPEREERLIEIVGHLNTMAAGSIDDLGERSKLSPQPRPPAFRSRHSSAYGSALGYLRIGQEFAAGESVDQRLRPHHGAGHRNIGNARI